ncbi:hypothetical protein MJD09_13645 [bacterium]|nr:hypothetical protein [bacterium]
MFSGGTIAGAGRVYTAARKTQIGTSSAAHGQPDKYHVANNKNSLNRQ